MERDYIAHGAAKIKLKLRLDRRGHKYEGIKKNNNFNSILLNKIEKTNLSLGGKFLTDGIETIMSQQISDEEKLQNIPRFRRDRFRWIRLYSWSYQNKKENKEKLCVKT